MSCPVRPIMATALLLTMPFFIACGSHKTYKDPLPEAYVATVKGSRAAVGVRIFFQLADADGEGEVAYSIEVPNGPQKINVYFSTPDGRVSQRPRSLSFYAEGGHTYRVQGTEYNKNVWLWIEDVDTKQVVGGRRP